MKRGDAVAIAVLALVAAGLFGGSAHNAILSAARVHPFLMGFVKFAILASLGELAARRVRDGRWSLPAGMIWRAVVWGSLGFCLVEMFAVFAAGVPATIESGLLPLRSIGLSRLLAALCTSVILNLAVGPVVMAVHRIADTYLDLAAGRGMGLRRVRLQQVVEGTDWQGLVSFVLLKTVPVFWIPAHTITFLLPAEYRVLWAALLSFAMGIILAFAKRPTSQNRCYPAPQMAA